MKIVSFIPIKLNNQRLPGKNTMELDGKPLCDYLFKTISDIDMIDEKLAEEQAKEPEKRNANREFELMYAKFIAGLKLSTGARLY